jgi:uncharacterized protein (TIGR02246 family)
VNDALRFRSSIGATGSASASAGRPSLSELTPLTRHVALLAIVCMALGGCRSLARESRHEHAAQRYEESQVVAALARYRQLVIDVDPERLADMFDVDGELSHNDEKPYKGHETILKFLKSFTGFKVQAYELRASSTTVDADRATQTGTYRQTVLSPEGATLDAEGSFKAEWRHQPDGRWLLRLMHTSSPGDARR